MATFPAFRETREPPSALIMSGALECCGSGQVLIEGGSLHCFVYGLSGGRSGGEGGGRSKIPDEQDRKHLRGIAVNHETQPSIEQSEGPRVVFGSCHPPTEASADVSASESGAVTPRERVE